MPSTLGGFPPKVRASFFLCCRRFLARVITKHYLLRQRHPVMEIPVHVKDFVGTSPAATISVLTVKTNWRNSSMISPAATFRS
jgi:hypothetical protein